MLPRRNLLWTKGDTAKLLPTIVTKKARATIANKQLASFSKPWGTWNKFAKANVTAKATGLKTRMIPANPNKAVLKVLFAAILSPFPRSIVKKQLTAELRPVTKTLIYDTSEFTRGIMPKPAMPRYLIRYGVNHIVTIT
jgi:hypothetical protein